MQISHSSTEQQRLLRPDDLTAAVELSSAAGWNQTAQDWHMLMDLAPDGCFAVEADRQLVSTTTLLCYQRRLAWIGMVLTKAEYRGRGFARRLLACALDRADALGIETIKLDATDLGRPIYESFGFQSEQPIERWLRSGSTDSQIIFDRQPLPAHVLGCDSKAFGVDRSTLLQSLMCRSNVYSDFKAYSLARAGRATAYLGPCVASELGAARNLIPRVINDSAHVSWSWDLLPGNSDAVALASELGFTRQRSLTRMARGKALRGRDEMVYAIAGFELG
jgi:predicted GNAT family N-acyltransferase